ncbi:hypothetical protein L7F22_055373 [Adiantum nelumboides]|nr:hypothetical protein [Adiantum nelumboides]
MSADYAIGQFRFLAKLLLVHGHWNTYRIGVLHQVFFYKNLIWTFALLLFQIFCESNATYLFDYSLVLLFNLIFTSLPVIMLGSLDQDVRAPALLAFPQTMLQAARASFTPAPSSGSPVSTASTSRSYALLSLQQPGTISPWSLPTVSRSIRSQPLERRRELLVCWRLISTAA